MKIGNIDLGARPVLLAPMEDVTDPAFRLMCKQMGADMVYTEFVSADALVRLVNRTARKLCISDEERPVAIQLYGKDPATMAEAARIVEEAKPDLIDLNFGCPVKKVAGKGAGAGMLRNIPLLLQTARAVVDAVRLMVMMMGDLRALGQQLGHAPHQHPGQHIPGLGFPDKTDEVANGFF